MKNLTRRYRVEYSRVMHRLAIVLLMALAPLIASSATNDFPSLGSAGKYYLGKFIWFDLVTSDLAAAQRFYGAVFGWQFRVIGQSPESYTVVEHAGRPIAGMFERAAPAGALRTARWLSLMSVADPAKVVRYVEEHGGTLVVPPASFGGRGTHALFRDPQGAIFGVLRSRTGDPPDTPVADGDFFWLDLLTTDPAAASQFYRDLAGYDVQTRDVNPNVKRVVLSAGGYARAGIAGLPPSVKQPGWLPYILVNDIDSTLAKVRTAGGRVLLEPRAELLDGNLAVIADPNNGVLGIINWMPTPATETKP